MKVNLNTVITGSKLVLVPYRREHVEEYHEWMLSEELRTLTASEPLTLEEEYDMQRKWQVDPDKLTFIILARPTDSDDGRQPGLDIMSPATSEEEVPLGQSLSNLQMVGDVNIFLKGPLDRLRQPRATRTPQDKNTVAHEVDDGDDDDDDDELVAEVEIMIAKPDFRQRGFASEALRLMLSYATGTPPSRFVDPSASDASSSFRTLPTFSSPLNISPSRVITRISDTNEPSIRLFKKLGFEVTKHVAVFEEVEMRFRDSTVN